MKKKNNKYFQAFDKKWFTVKDVDNFHFQCCDCSLTHRMQFKVSKSGKLSMCLEVDKEETNKARSKGEQKV